MVKMLKGFEKEYSEVVAEADIEITKDVIAKAKRLRLDVRKVRTGADKVHKEVKSEALRWGKAIDGVKNILKYAVEDKEKKLEDIEKHFENIEAEKIAVLQRERESILIKYEVENAENMGLGEMTEEGWKYFEAGLRSTYEAKIEAEKKAEKDRIATEKAEAEEKIRMAEENEKLKKKVEADKKKADAEKAKQKKKDDADAKKREAEDKKHKAEQKKISDKHESDQKKINDKLQKEREDKEKIAKQLKDQEDAIEKAKVNARKKKEDEEKAQKLADKKAKRAPDKDKLKVFVDNIKALEFPDVKSEEAEEIVEQTRILLEKVVKYIKSNSEKL